MMNQYKGNEEMSAPAMGLFCCMVADMKLLYYNVQKVLESALHNEKGCCEGGRGRGRVGGGWGVIAVGGS